MIVEFAISTTLSTSSLTGGASRTADYVESLRRESKAHVERSYTFGSALEQARQELCQLAEECSEPNWDGYRARPITEEVYQKSYRFLEALPLGMEVPSPGVEPDGEITFEWHHGPQHTLSVSVSEDGDLHYAAIMGANRTYGTEAFLGDIPTAISDLIARVGASSSSFQPA